MSHKSVLGTIRLPTSPLKPSALHNQFMSDFNAAPQQQQHQQKIEPGMTNILTAISANVKPELASADSTHGLENSRPEGGNAKKRKNAGSSGSAKTNSKAKKSKKTLEVISVDSVTFVKHHHSVKKPQTPSVSRRNARERNRVRQVNDGFSTLRNHIPHLKNKTRKYS